MKLFNSSGREMRPNFPTARPSDDAEPKARPSEHYGIFAEVNVGDWAYAQFATGFVARSENQVVVLSSGENYDGPRWDRLSLSLAPANWRKIEADRLVRQAAQSALNAQKETERIAAVAAKAAAAAAAWEAAAPERAEQSEQARLWVLAQVEGLTLEPSIAGLTIYGHCSDIKIGTGVVGYADAVSAESDRQADQKAADWGCRSEGASYVGLRFVIEASSAKMLEYINAARAQKSS